ncbi:MAG: P-loop NTPase [candidate division Zixibacteria bacterium]|nr:P-loop NTPase [candidate division Zixibacteria bacterium]
MKISVASGKGGTGKTTIAVNLAVALAGKDIDVALLDCDVEEPNGHIFLNPEYTESVPVTVPVPKVDFSRCTYCGECAEICQYNAIAVIPDNVMVFPKLCHGCGGCYHLCPPRAISEVNREIGKINSGHGRGVEFVEGRLNVGESQAPPLTKRLKQSVSKHEVVIIDAPPGTSCPVVEAVSESDYVILVSEPTPFGLNDLILAVEMVRRLGLPHGIVVNRADSGDDRMLKYCESEMLDILMKIPFDRRLAEAYSTGKLMSEIDRVYNENLFNMYTSIKGKISDARACDYQR